MADLFSLRPSLAHHLILAIITKMRIRSLCKLRRSCRWLYEFSSRYSWKLSNVVQIGVLSFLSWHQHETDWRKVAFVTSKFHNSFGPLSNYQAEDFRRLKMMSVQFPEEAESSAWLEGVLQHLEKYQIHVEELKLCVSSEKTFNRILQAVKPLKVVVHWFNPPPSEILKCPGLKDVTRLDIGGKLDYFDISFCQNSLRHLTVSGYHSPVDNLQDRINQVFCSSKLSTLLIKLDRRLQALWFAMIEEVSPEKLLLISAGSTPSEGFIYVKGVGLSQADELKEIQCRIEEALEVPRTPPFEDFEGDGEHDETGTTFLTSFADEGLDCSRFSSDQSMLSEHSHIE